MHETSHPSHDELQAIYDGMVDGLLIADVETKRFVRANPAICQMLGYSEEELLSLSVMDIHPAEELPALLEKFQTYAAGHIRINEDAPVVRKDGTMVYADIAGEGITYHERPCLIVFFRDITERKLAEAALRESNERIRAICDSALDAVVMIDPDGKALYWNPAAERMFGYSCDEILGRDVHAILTPSRYCEHALEAFEDFRISGRGRAVGNVLELTALRKDGTEFPIEIAVSGFKKSDKWCAAAIIRDISERKKAQAALERERGTLRHLLESSDHERHLISCEIHDGLAQQLAGAIMQFEAYKFAKDTNLERASEALSLGMQLVHEGNAEARRLISGLRLPQLKEGGVLAAIESLVEECNKQNRVKIEFCSDLAQVRLEPILENTICRIVQECVNNACRHSKSKAVKVELTQHDEQLRIEVQDWGVGFDVDSVSDGHFGLEGIRERAKVFGGHATITSSLGNGTDIIVELPLHPISLCDNSV
jgi:two-component system, LuxR family, sensor kinase FixL